MQVLPYGGTFDPEAAHAAERSGLARLALLIETPYGVMTLVQRGEALSELRFSGETLMARQLADTPLLQEAKRQLDAYFAGKLRQFDLPLAPLGTSFQTLIWQTLTAEVPYGQTITYGELAKRAGNPAASRAVGMANHRNPLPIFIPCHRVIGAGGKLVGYGGGLPLKQSLLNLEART
jgi:methylated-DNA-[protein]-cysteine S-methyltransferase